MAKLTLKKLCAFSDEEKGFVYDFNNDISIIHGANTSGKSTLIQTILYVFGINDMNKYLYRVYNESFYIRLDTYIMNSKQSEPLVVIREGNNVYVKCGNSPIQSFFGINANNSYEHEKLKKYFRNLFDYDLSLYNKDGLVEASLETMFLPYYISQSVGWVSIRKTFDGLEYYKNFKESFLDYCLGISNPNDLSEKYQKEKELSELKIKLNYITRFLEKDVSNIITNDGFAEQYVNYIDDVSNDENDLIELNNDFIKKSNELGLLKNKLKVVGLVKKNIKKLERNGYLCPVCESKLPDTIDAFYERRQNKFDCENEEKELKKQIKEISTDLDSIKKKRESLATEISQKRTSFESINLHGKTAEEWLNGEALYRLHQIIEKEKDNCSSQIEQCQNVVRKFKTEDEIKKERIKFSNKFKLLFEKYLSELNIKEYDKDPRYLDLYKITVLPCQGVELLKAHMAYHFAFNKIIAENNPKMPRLPFMLDAIFKEDVDEVNKDLILQFISKHRPQDTQIIFSMADSKDSNQITANQVKEIYFAGAKLIHISDNQRSLLDNYSEEVEKISLDTLNLLNQ
ncbi:MAG: AAA family ATPase [Bacteroidales bacterium]|nr:AAA family ATPase [Bacteroidales bacterium]